MSRWSGREIAQLCAAHAEGQPVDVIAANLHRTEKAVRTNLSRLGLSARRVTRPAAGAAPRTLSLLDVFLRKPSGTPLTFAPAPPAPPPAPTPQAGRRAIWTAAELAALTKQVADGLSNAEIAAGLGLSVQALANTLFRNGIRRLGRKPRSDRGNPRRAAA